MLAIAVCVALAERVTATAVANITWSAIKIRLTGRQTELTLAGVTTDPIAAATVTGAISIGPSGAGLAGTRGAVSITATERAGWVGIAHALFAVPTLGITMEAIPALCVVLTSRDTHIDCLSVTVLVGARSDLAALVAIPAAAITIGFTAAQADGLTVQG